MKFRPCIDLHQGQVKQIVGSTLQGDDSKVAENFATSRPASEFATMYQNDNLSGGHVIMLGPGNTEAAKSALQAYPNGLQVGGGINLDNATEWLEAGASHVIVTSFVFSQGQIHEQRLKDLVKLVGKQRLVLDLSCRRKDPNGPYYVVTDKWQKYTDYVVDENSLTELAQYCDEFLVHGVEVEGQQCGILDDLVELLQSSPIPVTYAGGVRSIEDLERVDKLGNGRVDCTVGSALDVFGGKLRYTDVVEWHKARNA